MVGGVEIPQTPTSSGVQSTEEIDIAINDLNSKFASISTVLEEIRFAIVGGGNHPNREDEEEGEETLDEYNRVPRRGDRPRAMVGRNVNHRGYGERQSYLVKAEIPNFVGNLDIEAVLDWLYEVDKFFDIMKVPEEEQVKVVAYKLRGGAGACGVDKNKESQPVNSNPYARPMIAKCFRCNEPRHRSNVCPKRSTYYSVKSENDGLTVDEAFQEEDELEYAEPLDGEAKQVTCVVQRTLSSPKIGWIKKGPTLKVTKICKVLLAIGKHYNELVTCDVVNMDACHVLLGRPWQHDMDATRQVKSNMYLFKWSGKTIAMLPLGVISPNKKLENKTLVTLVASPKEFQAERKETGVSYALVVKGVEDVMENAISAVIKPLLAEFECDACETEIGAVLSQEGRPVAFYSVCNKVTDALSKKTTLLVTITNEVVGFDSIKELYASDEDFGNIWMEIETKQHRGEFILLDGYLFKGNHLCIPKTSLMIQLIKEVHARGLSAHLGRDKTIVSVESRFYWTQLERDVGAFVKRCVACQEGKGKAQNTGLYMPLAVPESP
nr:RNA-directed DNA polymerase [Tanacetum cinerariifolium]